VVIHLESKSKPIGKEPSIAYNISLFAVPILSLFIIALLKGSFSVMVDFATSLSFLSAPFFAWLNIRLIKSELFPTEHKPGKAHFIFAYISFGFLILFCLAYAYILIS